MIPISQIKVGDVFSNPLFRNLGKLSGIEWRVVEIEKDDKLIKLQAHSYESCLPFGIPVWKRNTDRIISESWRINENIR